MISLGAVNPKLSYLKRALIHVPIAVFSAFRATGNYKIRGYDTCFATMRITDIILRKIKNTQITYCELLKLGISGNCRILNKYLTS